jgi:hypothetical protein
MTAGVCFLKDNLLFPILCMVERKNVRVTCCCDSFRLATVNDVLPMLWMVVQHGRVHLRNICVLNPNNRPTFEFMFVVRVMTKIENGREKKANIGGCIPRSFPKRTFLRGFSPRCAHGTIVTSVCVQDSVEYQVVTMTSMGVASLVNHIVFVLICLSLSLSSSIRTMLDHDHPNRG